MNKESFLDGISVHPANRYAFWWYKDHLYRNTFTLPNGKDSLISAGAQIDKHLAAADTYSLRWNEEVREAWEIFSLNKCPLATANEIINRRKVGKY